MKKIISLALGLFISFAPVMVAAAPLPDLDAEIAPSSSRADAYIEQNEHLSDQMHNQLNLGAETAPSSSRADAYIEQNGHPSDQMHNQVKHISSLYTDLVVSLTEEVFPRYVGKPSVADGDSSEKIKLAMPIRILSEAIFAMDARDRVISGLCTSQEDDPEAFPLEKFKEALSSALKEQIRVLNCEIRFIRRSNISLSKTRIMTPNGGIQAKIIEETEAFLYELRK